MNEKETYDYISEKLKFGYTLPILVKVLFRLAFKYLWIWVDLNYRRIRYK